MKTSLYLLLAAVIAALTAGGYYYFKEPVPKYSGTPWLMSDSTYFSPGNDDYLYYGWPINGSLLLIDYGTSTKFIKGQHQLIHPKLWANMPKLPFRITDRNAMVIYV